MADRIHVHPLTLSDGDLVLRPMTEDDQEFLHRWNNDEEVLWFMEGDHVTSRSLEDTMGIYRQVSRKAYVFVAELDHRPIGECWLQKMNMPEIVERHPEWTDIRRIDMAIGEKEMWDRGIGTRMLKLLTWLGFDVGRADAIYCLPGDYNPRSCRMVEKCGYTLEREVPVPPGGKGEFEREYVLTRAAWRALGAEG